MDILSLKLIRFVGSSLDRLRKFPKDVRQGIGWQLDDLQHGRNPTDSKPMPSIGLGVEEIRVWDETGTYRTVFTARFEEAIYVLHVFQKKTQQTSPRDKALAKKRLKEIERTRNEANKDQKLR